MSQPCGFLSDLVNCPYRQTYQTLIAPPYACPMCNGGFADRETIEMVQGPWGCNQMIRNQVGGNYAILGQWGNAPLMSRTWGGPAITSGAMVPSNGFTYDHRLTGPYAPRPMIANAPMMANGPMVANVPMLANGPMICDDYGAFDDGYYDDYGWDFDNRRRRRSKHRSHYKYRYSSKPATNCTVM